MFARWFVILPTSLTVAYGGQSYGLAAAAADLGQPQAPDQLARTFRALEAAEKEVPRDTFDPQAIVQKAGSDPVRLFEWVRDNTYWVPYRGALRGPVGVLMDRLGNSLDRSLLLAELLRTAGHRVQLAHGILPESRARGLLGQVQPVPFEPLPRPAQKSAEETQTDLARYAKDFQLDAQMLRTNYQAMTLQSGQMVGEVTKRVAVQAPFLTGAVGAPVSNDDLSRAVAAMSDHWWVQRQDGAQWIDLDPLLPSARPGAAYAERERTVGFDKPRGEMPSLGSFSQELTIRVIVEQWKAGRLTQKTALEHTLRPVDVVGQPIVLENIPLGWPTDSSFLQDVDGVGALKARALKAKEWLPRLVVGDRQIQQSSFTDTGDLNLKPGQGAGLGSAASALASGFDALGGGEPEAPTGTGQLTAEWIEYEIRVPGETPKTIRREILNLLDGSARSRQPAPAPSLDEPRRVERALNLLATIKILPQGFRLSRDYVVSQTLSQTVANRQALSTMVARMVAGDARGALDQAQHVKPMFSPLLSLAFARLEWSPAARNLYLAQPNILTYRTAIVQDRGRLAVRQGFDIVTNSLEVRLGSKVTAFEIRVTQGVTDTNAEGLLVPGGPAVTAGAILGTNKPNSQSWVTLRGMTDPAMATVAWPPESRSRVEEALKAGYVVIVPRAVPIAGGAGDWAWWRIDPKTGDTLGIGRQGWGQGMIEKALLGVVAGLYSFWIATNACLAMRQQNAGGPISQAQRSKNSFECLCLGVGGGFGIAAAAVGTGVTGFALVSLAVAVYCTGMSPQAP